MNRLDILNYRKLTEHRQRREEYYQSRVEFANIIGDKKSAETEKSERDSVLNNLDRYINSNEWMENPECLN